MASQRALRVVIAGGGTGGHLYPGIAVAREIAARRPDAAITFAGTARGIEADVVPREGFTLDLIRSTGLKRESLGRRLQAIGLMPFSLLDAWRVVSSRRPDMVIGVGGYSSGPVVAVASVRGVPTMILEQNAVPGLTNRLLAPLVRAAAVSFESTRAFFGPKAFTSGNPVRPELLGERGDRAAVAGAREAIERGGARAGGPGEGRQGGTGEGQPSAGVRTRILVFGGSQGAHAINVAMVEAAAELAARAGVHITHQTGARDVEMVRSAYRQAGLAADVEPFLYDIGTHLRRADLVVCRAGATTIAEITALGRPAILIPLPTAADDHQRKNAETLAAAGAADVLHQSGLTGRALAASILGLAADPERRARMASAAGTLARPDAAKVIVDRVLALVDE